MTLKLLIKQGVPDVVQSSECNIVHLIDPLFIQCLTREDAIVAKHELNHDEEDVLVEHEQDGVAVAAVSLTTMDEEKILQEAEFSDSKISCTGSLHALSACDSNANARFANHVTVVGSITNG